MKNDYKNSLNWLLILKKKKTLKLISESLRKAEKTARCHFGKIDFQLEMVSQNVRPSLILFNYSFSNLKSRFVTSS